MDKRLKIQDFIRHFLKLGNLFDTKLKFQRPIRHFKIQKLNRYLIKLVV